MIILRFAVINIRKGHKAAPYFPAFVGGNDLPAAIRIPQMQLCNEGKGSLWVCLAGKAEFALIPAPAKQHRKLIFLPQKFRHIVGAILKMLFVIVDKGRQQVVADFFTVQTRLKKSKPADIQPRLPHCSRKGKPLSIFRVEIFRLGKADPSALPWLCEFGCLKTAESLRCFPDI